MNWIEGFARQAKSDLQARDALLEHPMLPRCHELHFLQMAAEKLSKAFLIAGGAEPLSLQQSHAYVAKQLPIIVRHYFSVLAENGALQPWMLRGIRGLSEKIELLAPSVDRAGTAPTNCEYPWDLPSSFVIPPCDHRFDIDLHQKPGRALLKTMRFALDQLIKNAPEFGLAQ